MDMTEEPTCTLRAEDHHTPCVMESAGFCTEHSSQIHSIGFEDEMSPTLRAGVVPAAVALENHPSDSRAKLSEDGMVQTPTSRMETGGGNIPLVMDADAPKTLKIRSGCDGGGKGALLQENMSATLGCSNDQTVFVPTAYGICSKHSHSMLSDNPKSGFYEAGTTRTIDTGGSNPSCNQGGIAVIEGNGSRPSHKGDGFKESDVMYTLNRVEQHGVAYGIDRAAFNQGANAKFGFSVNEECQPAMTAKGAGAVAMLSMNKNYHRTNPEEGLVNILVTSDHKAHQCVKDAAATDYIVRRLTPTECARLQGFPDWWCAGLGTENPTNEELTFWRSVFDTYANINGTKPKSDRQVLKWLKNPQSDSAEYRLWGNGISLPVAYFVLSGIVYYALNSTAEFV